MFRVLIAIYILYLLSHYCEYRNSIRSLDEIEQRRILRFHVSNTFCTDVSNEKHIDIHGNAVNETYIIHPCMYWRRRIQRNHRGYIYCTVKNIYDSRINSTVEHTSCYPSFEPNDKYDFLSTLYTVQKEKDNDKYSLHVAVGMKPESDTMLVIIGIILILMIYSIYNSTHCSDNNTILTFVSGCIFSSIVAPSPYMRYQTEGISWTTVREETTW
jgi:hypothetical protein